MITAYDDFVKELEIEDGIERIVVCVFVFIPGKTPHTLIYDKIRENLFHFKRIYIKEDKEVQEDFDVYTIDECRTFHRRAMELGWTVITYALNRRKRIRF